MCCERGISSPAAFNSLFFAVRTPLQKVGCGGSRYEVICIFREKSHGRQPCARYHGNDLLIVGRSRAA